MTIGTLIWLLISYVPIPTGGQTIKVEAHITKQGCQAAVKKLDKIEAWCVEATLKD
jgi:hypothetical protein